LISNEGPPDPVYEKLEQTFSPGDIVALSLAIVVLSLAIVASTAGTGWRKSMRAPVGAYVSQHRRRSNRFAASPQVGLAGTHAKQEGEPCP
jgi:hypothetical protein